ncbi:MAG: prolipoprotein diacylglyceryl transferase [Clostridia bacterium]|nr:prolipoprotein diacylglyceryl transferase [Clostridia bacterium]
MENYINLFGLEFNIDPVAFTIPGINWKVYWYGIIITVGFCLALLYGMKKAKSLGVDPDRLLDVILVTAPIAILCARFYFVLFNEHTDFSEFFLIHDGGLAIPGGLIGAVVVGTLMCKLRKVNVLSALDLASLGFLIGQSIGRWGNFVNQEAYGGYTGSTWFGMTGGRIAADMGPSLVHPCFLYESLWCALGFVLLHILSKKRSFNGQIATMYLIWYGLGRSVIEQLRTDALVSGNIRVTQILSVLMVIAGIVILAVVHKKQSDAKKQEGYVPVFDVDEDNDEEISQQEYSEIEQDILEEVENEVAEVTEQEEQNG